jgi:hypothetical protein
MRASTQIGVGTDVKFDSDHGTQLGKVADIKSDVTNGRRVAAVQVPGTLDGQPWHVPVDQLRPAGITV